MDRIRFSLPSITKGRRHDESGSYAYASDTTGTASVGTNIPEPEPLSSPCGPPHVKFDVKLDRSQHSLRQPEPGKALVYVIEVFQRPPGELGTPTIRVGLNEVWVVANRGTSYLSFSVGAGENHVCTNWQSVLKQLSSQHSLTSFVAEAGKIYFFRVQTHFETYSSGYLPSMHSESNGEGDEKIR